MADKGNLGRWLKFGIPAVLLAGLISWSVRDSGNGESPDVQRVEKLAKKKDAAGLLKAMKDPNPEAASRAIEEYARLRPEDVEAQITPMLQAPDATVRMAAVYAVAQGNNPVLVRPLSGALTQDPDSRVRSAAAKSLGQMRAFDGMNSLIAGLDDPDPFVRQCSIESVQKVLGVHYAYKADDPRDKRLAIIAQIRREFPSFEKTVKKDVARASFGRN